MPEPKFPEGDGSPWPEGAVYLSQVANEMEARKARVVNIRDFYVTMHGTRRLRFPPDVVRVDRRTTYGNPYVIGEEAWFESDPTVRFVIDRPLAIHMFRLHLKQVLKTDPTFLEPLRGKRLACWCSPDEDGNVVPCHAFVILEFLDESAPEASRA